ncbi:hypothetical protein [Enemella sp. A6]|uniref:hypothetical protein n=1 Tax=Enemella sp. A6 TaxID=3440152 RepID=UPI003EBF03C5
MNSQSAVKSLGTGLVVVLLSLTTACASGNAPETGQTPEASPTAPASTPQETIPADSPEPSTTESATESPAESTSPSGEFVLTFEGLGDIKLGDRDLAEKGAVAKKEAGECGEIYAATGMYEEMGIAFTLDDESKMPDSPLIDITLTEYPSGDPNAPETFGGVLPGMTFADVKSKHPEAEQVTKNGNGGPFKVYSQRQGEVELVFRSAEFSDKDIADQDKVQSISLRKYSEGDFGGC